jgi:hypothetical protein
VTLPVKNVVAVNRLTSTDSGIDIEFDDDSQLIDVVKEDTAYRTSVDSDIEIDLSSDESDDAKVVDGDVSAPSKTEEHLAFPTYTCNVYDELVSIL